MTQVYPDISAILQAKQERRFALAALSWEEKVAIIEQMQRLLLPGQMRSATVVEHKCEYCNGTVHPRLMEREIFKHKKGFVILENVLIGVCDGCGDRYYSAEILHTVHEIATGRRQPERTEAVPLAYAGQTSVPVPA